MKSLFTQFEVLEDTRDIRGKKHKLIDIIILSIYGFLCGYTDFDNMVDFLMLKEDYFIELLGLTNGIPSHDTFSRVFATIEPKKFMELFIDWIKTIVADNGNFISIDGKAIKSATDRVNNKKTPYIVSAFLSDVKLSIGQVKVDDKSNELTAIPALIEILDIKGKIITIDAIGTQENIANKTVENKGDYVLKVKGNQKDLLDDIKTYFDMEIDSLDVAMETTKVEKNHGRIEKRTYCLSYTTDIIHNKKKWKTVKGIGKMTVEKYVNGKTTKSDYYYIFSKMLTLDEFICAVRSHWNIECSLHWKLDVILDEDHSTNKKGNSIDNISTIRKIVFNLAHLDKSMGEGLSLKKKLTRYSLDFAKIENLIFSAIPNLV